MNSINLSEHCHVVSLGFPASGKTTTDFFSMKNHSHASIILTQGLATSGTTVTVKRAESAASANSSAIAFQYAVETTSGLDSLGARASATTSGYTLGSGSNQTLVIELDASEACTASSPWITVELASNTDAADLVSVVAVLSGSRFAKPESSSVLS